VDFGVHERQNCPNFALRQPKKRIFFRKFGNNVEHVLTKKKQVDWASFRSVLVQKPTYSLSKVDLSVRELQKCPNSTLKQAQKLVLREKFGNSVEYVLIQKFCRSDFIQSRSGSKTNLQFEYPRTAKVSKLRTETS